MNFGEKIFALRSKMNMSQGDLADRLEVSRQSISKWENNSAVPDLDKIIKMSEIFGVTIDELVKEEQQVHPMPQVYPMGTGYTTGNTVESGYATAGKKDSGVGLSKRVIVGLVIFAVAFALRLLITFANIIISRIIGGGVMAGIFPGIILTSPLWICGIICLVFKKHIGLFCGWGIYFVIDIYIRIATGISWKGIFNRMFYYEETIFTARNVVAWIEFALLFILVISTVFICRKDALERNKKNLIKIMITWGVTIGISVFLIILPYTELYNFILSNIRVISPLYGVASGLLDWCGIVAFVYAITGSVRYLKSDK